MFKLGLLATLAIPIAVILVLWVAGNAFGFRISLVSSLVMSIGLTLVLNLILGAFRGRDRRMI
jgi:hypothetical protein